jgi:hypothetical protein
MEPGYITWSSTPTGWLAMIRDAHGRTWAVSISRSEGQRMQLTVTMLCREAGLYRSNNMAQTFSEAQEWCYEQLGLTDA